MRKATSLVLLGLALSGLFGLGGCGGKLPPLALPKLPPPPPPPTELVLDVHAARGMNPTAAGQGAPLLVRIYELSAKGRFMEADLSRLLADDRSELAADLLAREEARFVPGEQRRIETTLNPGTRELGVLAAYRNTDGITWRTVLPTKAETVNRVRLDLGPRELKLAPAD